MKQILLGFHAVQTRLRMDPDSLQSVYYDPARRDRRMADFIKQAEPLLGKRLYSANADRLHNLAGHDRHQGIVALAEPISIARTLPELLDSIDAKNDPPLLLVLDGITDPHNLGACLRAADGAGVHGVIVPKDRSASINATVSKVASGAAEVVPIITVTNLARTMREMQELGIWLIGTDDQAEQSIYDVD
ncbi:MAG: 23S rRNA (guanosine(2251)-2'-O)-methyltransferase RlmB, partial [Burkholderiaceae bacterium]|nr:23S rRNA (guanosine(2251)-2'-O)-methyltransferase RlmB [Burkholderiaceae bacterium]NBV81574.1 23S rRNA (guanosine(2251)-2'-O)-methyltransferase RlmB [Burkholderiaceae bacterium]